MISGTSIMAPLPMSKAFCVRRKYTCVFPLPVTPCNNTTFAASRSISAATVSKARCCSSLSVSDGGGVTGISAGGVSMSERRIRPDFSISRRIRVDAPVK